MQKMDAKTKILFIMLHAIMNQTKTIHSVCQQLCTVKIYDVTGMGPLFDTDSKIYIHIATHEDCNKSDHNNNNNSNDNHSDINKTDEVIHENLVVISSRNFLKKIGNVLTSFVNCTVSVSVRENLKRLIILEMLWETHNNGVRQKKENSFQSTKSVKCMRKETESFINHLSILHERHTVGCTYVIVEANTCGEKLAETFVDTITRRHSSYYTCANIIRMNYLEKETYPLIALTEVKELGYGKQTFVLLTDIVTTSTILNTARELGMMRYDNLWIVEKLKENDLPFQLMAFSYTQTYKFQSAKLSPKTSVIKQLDSYGTTTFYTEITTHINNQWRLLYILNNTFLNTTGNIINNNNNTSKTAGIQQSQQIYDFVGLPITSSTPTDELLIVSILEGPFLFSSHYRYNKFKRVCNRNSMLCWIPSSSKGNTARTVWKESCCFGFTVELINHLTILLNLNVKLYITEDGKYGGYLPKNDTYNGMVGDVLKGKASMAIAGLTVTSHRSKYVDFTVPFLRSQIGIVTLKTFKNTNYINFRFIATISADAKYSFLGFYMFVITLLYLLDTLTIYFKNDEKGIDDDVKIYSSNVPVKRPERYSLLESITSITGHFFQRNLTVKMPNSITGKIFSKILAFSMLAFITLYVASLTADQVIDDDQNKFLGLKDRRMTHPTEDFKFGSLEASSTLAFFRNAPDDSLNRMYHFMRKYSTTSALEGMHKVLNGQLQAYLGEAIFADYAIAQISNDCKLETHENPVGQRSYGIAVAKNSSLKYTLSRALLYLIEEGSILHLQTKWLSSACQNINKPSHEKFDYTFFATPMLLLAGSILGSVLLLICETTLHKIRRKRRRLVKPKL